MSLADKQALALRDLAVIVAKAKGHTYHDARLRIDHPAHIDRFNR